MYKVYYIKAICVIYYFTQLHFTCFSENSPKMCEKYFHKH